MRREDHYQATMDLITSLIARAPQQYTTEKGRWVWAAGRLASMLVKASHNDSELKRELTAIKQQASQRKHIK